MPEVDLRYAAAAVALERRRFDQHDEPDARQSRRFDGFQFRFFRSVVHLGRFGVQVRSTTRLSLPICGASTVRLTNAER